MHCRKTNSFRFIVSRHRNFIILRSPFLLHPTFLINVRTRCTKRNTKTKRGYCSLLESSTLLLERSKKEEITRYRSKGEKYVIDSKVINFVRPVIVPRCNALFSISKIIIGERGKETIQSTFFLLPVLLSEGGHLD